MDAHDPEGWQFEVWQNDEMVASASSPDRNKALREALHYAMIYGDSSSVEVYEVRRSAIDITDAAEWLASAG